MAVADYFDRSAMAAGQVLSGQDPATLRARLESVTVGLSFGREAASTTEGRALLDLLTRILARLYPRIVFGRAALSEPLADALSRLALSINPKIEIARSIPPNIEVIVGSGVEPVCDTKVFCGSQGWKALISSTSPQRVGDSHNPFGAGAAACLTAANVFRSIFLAPGEWFPDQGLQFSTLPSSADPPADNLLLEMDVGEVVLAGLGAIGMACVWALGQLSLKGLLHLVDPQSVELSNLQRYVLCGTEDISVDKVAIAMRFLEGKILAEPHGLSWQDFSVNRGYAFRNVLVALDSAADRRAVQASLPEWIANAWTQTGDLGVSLHDFQSGACLDCLYLPSGVSPGEDVIIAQALKIPERFEQVRELLYHGKSAPSDLLQLIAQRCTVPLNVVLAFGDLPIRSLYVSGICGGQILPLGRTSAATQDVHVPLAHQSALAGVLLGAGLAAKCLGLLPHRTLITRIDVMHKIANGRPQDAAKDPRGICICQDNDYVSAYKRKYVEISES